jgi:hypothetical protein
MGGMLELDLGKVGSGGGYPFGAWRTINHILRGYIFLRKIIF